MTTIEIRTGMKTIIVKKYSTSETCPDNYRTSYQAFRYTEDWELAEIREMLSNLPDDISTQTMILNDYALNDIINAKNWSH